MPQREWFANDVFDSTELGISQIMRIQALDCAGAALFPYLAQGSDK